MVQQLVAKNGQTKTSRLVRNSLSMAVGLLISSIAIAQSSEGSIFGQAKADAPVTITNLDGGAARTIKSDAAGNFALSKLPPGRYKIESAGVVREVVVSIGSGTQVLLAGQVESVEVTSSRGRSIIDVRSVESNTVFTQAQMRELPVARDVNSVALLAPGVVKGDAGLGDGGIPSFGGASVAENGYYINGFDVTNIRNFLSYANLPFDAIGEQQIKTGGYGAEYGRSLGGVVSLSTKKGTNEWKGGTSVYWAPSALQSKGKNVKDNEPEGAGSSYYLFQQANKSDSLSTNAYIGGPIIKDKLYIFALAEGVNNTKDTFGISQSTQSKMTKPNGMVKIDFLPNDQNRLELTAINNKKSYSIADYTNSAPYSTTHDGTAKISQQTSGGDVTIAKWSSYLTDNLTVSALAGKVNYQQPLTTGARTEGANCPTVYVLPGVTYAGCWNGVFPGLPGRDPSAPPTDYDKRDAFRFDVDYVIGKHTVRFGIDNQTFKSAEAGGSAYSGGQYFRDLTATTGNVGGASVPVGTVYTRLRESNYTSGVYSVENSAKYIEDSWRFQKDIFLYAGMRWESFNNKNGDGDSFVKKDNLIAPRLGASWDVNGDASFKVYGNAGRYYIPVASNTNIRATRGETVTESYYTYTGRDPVTAKPLNLVKIGNTITSADGSLALPATIADTNLQPMSQDEFILGFQKAISKGWTFGTKLTQRKIRNGMDDWCDTPTVGAWVTANGHPQFDYHTMAHCQLVNPGRDVTLMMDVKNDGVLQSVTIPAAATGLAAYTRTYNALEFTLDKAFDGKWGGSASYTFGKSKGTTEGYVNSTINQEDAGVTQEFDFGTFTHGANGYLPNDRRHQVKLFGVFAVSEDIKVGINLNSTSGRPLSRIGFVPSTTPGDASTYTTASTYYYLDSTGTTVLGQRGDQGRTPWTHSIDVQAAYTKKINANTLTFQVGIFNLLNTQTATEFNEINDYSRSTTTVGLPGRVSLNYGLPSSFQTPRSVRFTTRYEF
jgi:hypothetical protein